MSRSDRVLVAAGGASMLLTAAAVALLLMPAEGAASPDDAALLVPGPTATDAAPVSPAAAAGSVVVDVAGAVAAPGLHELAAGARVGDAIAAAGGYASDADLDAIAANLNLARLLADGEQVRVPRLGEGAAMGPGGTPGAAATAPPGGGGEVGGSTGSLVNVNTATPEELEALPGIGPVTVQKIVAARQERPFTSLDDLVQRGVIHRGQLEDIRDHATAG